MRLLATLCLLTCALTASAAPAMPPVPASPGLEFIQNKGQWDAPARYAAPLPGGRLFVEANRLRLVLLQDVTLPGHGHGPETAPAPAAAALAPSDKILGHTVDIQFEGSSPAVRLSAETLTDEHRNYFQGNDPARWAADVRSYRQVRYAGLWAGIDARLYENERQQLEYDFDVAAGADPAAIVLRHAGATPVLDALGNLVLTTPVRTIRQLAPRAWQTLPGGQRQAVACRYQLGADGTVRFALGRYDKKLALTIDPTVVFSTFSGSLADNWGFTATYDAAGNLYSGGIVFAAGYPISPGAFQSTFGGIIDIALIKYRVAANGPAARVWSTVLGGSQADFPHSLVVNNQGELLVLGSTSSLNYPTTVGALQRTFGGGTTANPFGFDATNVFFAPYLVPQGSDIVVTRLNAAGTALVGSTYFGGSANDGLQPLNNMLSAFSGNPQLPHNYGDAFRGDIVVDAADNVYIASCTSSNNLALPGGFASAYRGGASDGLVCKFTPGLTALTWGSYLGGSAADAAFSLQIEPVSGDVYVAGGTLSANFPTTTTGLQPTRPGNVDGFAVRIAASGGSILRGTYLGTSSYDQAFFLQLGTDGGVYVLGQTLGQYPTTAGLYRNAGGRQFIQKMDANLGVRQLATVFGSGRSTLDISPTAFLVDRCDRVYVCGWGGEDNQLGDGFSTYPYLLANGTTAGMPTTTNAFQSITDGSDFYLAQFSAGLTALDYGTFYGGIGLAEHVDGGTSRFDQRGLVYHAVCSCGSLGNFPIPPGANTYTTFNNSLNCNNAAFVLDFQPQLATAGANATVCATAAPLVLGGSPAGGTWTGPGVSGTPAAGYVFTPSLALLGTQTLTYTVTNTGQCTSSDTRAVTVTPPPTVSLALPQTLFCQPAPGSAPLPSAPLVATPTGGTFSGPGVSGSPASGFIFNPNQAGAGTHTVTYTYTATGCTVRESQAVQVLRVSVGPPVPLCSSAAPLALGGSPAGGIWAGPGVSGTPAAGYTFNPATVRVGANNLTYTVSISDASGICTTVAARVITVEAEAVLSIAPLPALCANDAPRLLVASPAGGTFSGPGVSGSPATGYRFDPAVTGTGTFQLNYVGSSTICPVQGSATVTVRPSVTLVQQPDTVLCPGSSRPIALVASPAGGTFSGPGVSGSPATGYVFTPPAGFVGSALITYTMGSGGCVTTATRRISAAPEPAFTPAWAPVACPAERQVPLLVRFTVPAVVGATVAWDFGDGSPAATGPEVTHTYTEVGRYQPRATLRYLNDRCETVQQLPPLETRNEVIPNIITPNDDLLNNYFRLPPSCPARLQIFSRWGQKVFEAAEYRNDWDASGQPAGTYYYLARYADGRQVKGWLEVMK